ncbi:MAG: hypothetical protein JO216_08750 [Hyphomicrobiales bacterium]|nr:hypothetical protein [Hyphomicrobiales bacterium]
MRLLHLFARVFADRAQNNDRAPCCEREQEKGQREGARRSRNDTLPDDGCTQWRIGFCCGGAHVVEASSRASQESARLMIEASYNLLLLARSSIALRIRA